MITLKYLQADCTRTSTLGDCCRTGDHSSRAAKNLDTRRTEVPYTKIMNVTESGAATKTTRRNGQLMSCEPCRRSKQRCDHGWPHCMRCRKRGKTAEAKCHYHPAPMTRGARLVTPPQSSTRSSRTSESRSEFVDQPR